MAKAAHSEDLRAAFQKHQRETEGQVQRLEKVFQLIEEPAKGKKCAAIEGIIEEGQEIMEEYKGSHALDAGLLAAAQAVEHYEISRYGTLKAWAEKLGLPQARSCSTRRSRKRRTPTKRSRNWRKQRSIRKLKQRRVGNGSVSP